MGDFLKTVKRERRTVYIDAVLLRFIFGLLAGFMLKLALNIVLLSSNSYTIISLATISFTILLSMIALFKPLTSDERFENNVITVLCMMLLRDNLKKEDIINQVMDIVGGYTPYKRYYKCYKLLPALALIIGIILGNALGGLIIGKHLPSLSLGSNLWFVVGSGLATGLLAGLLSSWIISKYFRDKAKDEEWKERIFFDKRILSGYIDLIVDEIDILRRDMEPYNDKQGSLNNLIMLLTQVPSFGKSNTNRLPDWSHDITKRFYDLIQEIEENIVAGKLANTQLVNYRSRLKKSQFEILIISQVDSDPRNEQ